ncbi:hypothetical protein ACFLU3_04815 [Chloroflexota bacterium]
MRDTIGLIRKNENPTNGAWKHGDKPDILMDIRKGFEIQWAID